MPASCGVYSLLGQATTVAWPLPMLQMRQLACRIVYDNYFGKMLIKLRQIHQLYQLRHFWYQMRTYASLCSLGLPGPHRNGSNFRGNSLLRVRLPRDSLIPSCPILPPIHYKDYKNHSITTQVLEICEIYAIYYIYYNSDNLIEIQQCSNNSCSNNECICVANFNVHKHTTTDLQ